MLVLIEGEIYRNVTRKEESRRLVPWRIMLALAEIAGKWRRASPRDNGLKVAWTDKSLKMFAKPRQQPYHMKTPSTLIHCIRYLLDRRRLGNKNKDHLLWTTLSSKGSQIPRMVEFWL